MGFFNACSIIYIGDIMVCNVQLEVKARGLNKPFTYLIPESLLNQVAVGKRVLVPFGKRSLSGFIMSIEQNYSGQQVLKPIIKVLDNQIIINQELTALVDYMINLTLSTKSKILDTILPKALRANIKQDIQRKQIQVIKPLVGKEQIKDYIRQKRLGKNQLIVLEDILKGVIIYKNRYPSSTYQRLIKDKIIIIESNPSIEIQCQEEAYPKHQLNLEQQKAYEQIVNCFDSAQTFLLLGVTGSGKTEVYLHLIEDIIKRGKQALVLVPEISLTPQIEKRFIGRFKNGVATLHSRLNEREKLEIWERAKSGDLKVVIGPRSAVFTPFENLGIIIMDEEHETSYKQTNDPRYHTLDIAKFRSNYQKIPLVLGSATPSLESMARAIKGVYQLIKIEKRANGQFPAITIIDKNQLVESNRIFSTVLQNKIRLRLDHGEQVILFLNRRGFNTISSCVNCGHYLKCPHCDIALIYHQSEHRLCCHYCGYYEEASSICPNCQQPAIRRLGLGTERLASEVAKLFPQARIIRMDQDVTTKKHSHQSLINSFACGQADILIGTQMVAKGLDFPNVTLVGVINADNSLNIPDFRSAERTFQLLTQVSGRSGRATTSGEVVIETYNPDHYSILNVKNHDYNNFFKTEMNLRKKLQYPPYVYLTLIRLSSKDEQIISQEIKKIMKILKTKLDEHYTILGPSSINKIGGIYRMHLLIKYKKDQLLQPVLNEILSIYQNNKQLKIDIDINPLNI